MLSRTDAVGTAPVESGVRQRELRRVGRVTAAENGARALESTRVHFFDAIVSDIRMPQMSGIDFHRRAAQEHPDIANRFVFVSLDPSAEDAAYLRDHQLPLLEKPFSVDALTETVYRVISTASGANETTGGAV